jgi:hypothetical protein
MTDEEDANGVKNNRDWKDACYEIIETGRMRGTSISGDLKDAYIDNVTQNYLHNFLY